MYLFLSILLPLICLGQDTVQVQKIKEEYKKFFKTKLVALNDDGGKIILNNSNNYGYNEFQLFNSQNKKLFPLIKGRRFKFLSTNELLIENDTCVRFQNLLNKNFVDVKGIPAVKILKKRKLVILHFITIKILKLYDFSGRQLSEFKYVDNFDVDLNENFLIQSSKQTITQTDLKTLSSNNISLNNEVFCIKNDIGKTYILEKDNKKSVTLLEINRDLHKIDSSQLNMPESFELSNDYFEIREDRFVILTLTKKIVGNSNKTANVIINYTNQNSNENLYTNYLAIFDKLNKSWRWVPDSKQKAKLTNFLNSKGDFIVFDILQDHVEKDMHPMSNAQIILNYGSRQFEVGKLRTEATNYHWDEDSQRFLFFKNKKWWCFHSDDHTTHQLLYNIKQSWVNNDKNELTDLPFDEIIATEEKSKVIITAAYDLFLYNIVTHEIKQLTFGEKEKLRYRIVKPAYVETSMWKNNRTHINVSKGVYLSMFKVDNFYSGYSILKNSKLHNVIFDGNHYKDLIQTKNNTFIYSYSVNKPFVIKQLRKKQFAEIFNSSVIFHNTLSDLRIELFQYTTLTGKHLAGLVFPINYNPEKSTP